SETFGLSAQVGVSEQRADDGNRVGTGSMGQARIVGGDATDGNEGNPVTGAQRFLVEPLANFGHALQWRVNRFGLGGRNKKRPQRDVVSPCCQGVLNVSQ